jgi:hypothetical protein
MVPLASTTAQPPGAQPGHCGGRLLQVGQQHVVKRRHEHEVGGRGGADLGGGLLVAAAACGVARDRLGEKRTDIGGPRGQVVAGQLG